MRPSEFRQIIRQAGRVPAERYTTYTTRRVFNDEDEELDPLDLVGENVEELFGSYNLLVQMDKFRFQHPKYADRAPDQAGKSVPAVTPSRTSG